MQMAEVKLLNPSAGQQCHEEAKPIIHKAVVAVSGAGQWMDAG